MYLSNESTHKLEKKLKTVSELKAELANLNKVIEQVENKMGYKVIEGLVFKRVESKKNAVWPYTSQSESWIQVGVYDFHTGE